MAERDNEHTWTHEESRAMAKNRRNNRRYNGNGQNQHQYRRNGNEMRPYAYNGHRPNNSHCHGNYHPQTMNDYQSNQIRRGPQPPRSGCPLHHQPQQYPQQQFQDQSQQFLPQGQLLQQQFIPRPRSRLSGVDSNEFCAPSNPASATQPPDQSLYNAITDPYFLADLYPPGVDEHWYEETVRWIETSGRYQRPVTSADAGTGWMGDIEQLVADSDDVETRLVDALRDFDSGQQEATQAEIDGWIPEDNEDDLE